jgi:hypothetical protein
MLGNLPVGRPRGPIADKDIVCRRFSRHRHLGTARIRHPVSPAAAASVPALAPRPNGKTDASAECRLRFEESLACPLTAATRVRTRDRGIDLIDAPTRRRLR